MNKIISFSVLLIGIAVFYYLVIFIPSRAEQTNIQKLQEQKLSQEINKENNRGKYLSACETWAKNQTYNYIKSLVYPQKIPNFTEMSNKLTSDCMKNNGY